MNKKLSVSMVIIIMVLTAAGLLLFWPKTPDDISDQQLKTGLAVTSVERIDNGSAEIKINGYVNGDNWVAFEAQAGVVRFLDQNKNELGFALLTTIGEWMIPPPINFEAYIIMPKNKADQVTSLLFRNENPSGDPTRDREFAMSVDLKPTTETITLKVFFGFIDDVASSCDKVTAVDRKINKTEAVARVALEALLLGPAKEEKDEGLFTSIPVGSELNSIFIVNGEARADFNEITESGGGSCSMAARTAQIRETLLQFPTVTSVRLSINGRTEDIFQP